MHCPNCNAALPQSLIIVVDGHMDFTFDEDGRGVGLHCHTYDDDRTAYCTECGHEIATNYSDLPGLQALLDNPDRGQELQWG